MTFSKFSDFLFIQIILKGLAGGTGPGWGDLVFRHGVQIRIFLRHLLMLKFIGLKFLFLLLLLPFLSHTMTTHFFSHLVQGMLPSSESFFSLSNISSDS